MGHWRALVAATAVLGAVGAASLAPAAAAPSRPGGPVAVVHAAPQGRGGGHSAHDPASLPRARDLARTAAARGDRDVLVLLAGGTYRLSAPLTLDARDGGRAGRTVTWRSASAAHPAVLSGGARVTGWTLIDPDRRIWRADWRDRLGPDAAPPRQLFVDGRRAVRAHGGSCGRSTCPVTADGIGGAHASGVAAFRRPQDVDAVFRIRWRNFHCRVTGVTGAGGDTLAMARPCWTNSGSGTHRTGPGWDSAAVDAAGAPGVRYFENAPELIDGPGQFAATSDGVLTYRARRGEDPNRADTEIPATETLLTVAGTPGSPVRGLRLEGLHFRYAAWHLPGTADGYAGAQAGFVLTGATGPADQAGRYYTKPAAALVVRGGRDVRVSGAHFAHLGGAGAVLEAGTGGSSVTGSTFEDLSSGAVYVGDLEPEPGEGLRCDGNTVARNTIVRVGADYTDAVGIWAGYVTGLTVDHNTLSHLPYSGISVGWGWNQPVARHPHLGGNRITGNRITDVLRAGIGQHDGGAIYTQGPQPGTVVSGNYVNRVSYPPEERDGNGIYLDEQSSDILVESNVVTRVGYKWVSNWAEYGVRNTVRGNWADSTAPALGGAGSTMTGNREDLAALPPEAVAVAERAGVRPGPVEQPD